MQQRRRREQASTQRGLAEIGASKVVTRAAGTSRVDAAAQHGIARKAEVRSTETVMRNGDLQNWSMLRTCSSSRSGPANGRAVDDNFERPWMVQTGPLRAFIDRREGPRANVMCRPARGLVVRQTRIVIT